MLCEVANSWVTRGATQCGYCRTDTVPSTAGNHTLSLASRSKYSTPGRAAGEILFSVGLRDAD